MRWPAPNWRSSRRSPAPRATRSARRSRSRACRCTSIDTAGLREARRRGRAHRHRAQLARDRGGRRCGAVLHDLTRAASRLRAADSASASASPRCAGRSHRCSRSGTRPTSPPAPLPMRWRCRHAPAKGSTRCAARCSNTPAGTAAAEGRVHRPRTRMCRRCGAARPRCSRRTALLDAEAPALDLLAEELRLAHERARRDHRRIQLRRPARRDLRPLLHRQVKPL